MRLHNLQVHLLLQTDCWHVFLQMQTNLSSKSIPQQPWWLFLSDTVIWPHGLAWLASCTGDTVSFIYWPITQLPSDSSTSNHLICQEPLFPPRNNRPIQNPPPIATLTHSYLRGSLQMSSGLIKYFTLTLMLLAANLAITKWCKKRRKMTVTLTNGFSYESTQREPSNEYLHDNV